MSPTIAQVFTLSALMSLCGLGLTNPILANERSQIADLPNGNYRFCDRQPQQPGSRIVVDGWCFDFRKAGDRVVGTYVFSAPKGDRSICLSGRINGNAIQASEALEYWFAWNQPVTLKGVRFSKWWDGNVEGREVDDTEGRHLMVGTPRIIKSMQQGNEYSAWLRYDTATLDLQRFYRHPTPTKQVPKICNPI